MLSYPTRYNVKNKTGAGHGVSLGRDGQTNWELQGRETDMQNRTAPQTSGIDPMTRRKLLFSLSQPTNPVAGALLPHINQHATPRALAAWERNGWIAYRAGHFYLTELGRDAIREPSPTSPDSYYHMDYSPNW